MSDIKDTFALAEDKGYTGYFIETENEIYSYIELCLIQKWLREQCSIIVEANYIASDNPPEYDYNYGKILPIGLWTFPRVFFKSYEEALSEGIKEALQLI